MHPPFAYTADRDGGVRDITLFGTVVLESVLSSDAIAFVEMANKAFKDSTTAIIEDIRRLARGAVALQAAGVDPPELGVLLNELAERYEKEEHRVANKKTHSVS